MVKKYNISKPEKYVSQGQEKTMWHNVGTMTEFVKPDGSVSRILEIPAIGLKANIFPFQDKGQSSQLERQAQVHQEHTQELPSVDVDEDIKPEDFPF